MQAPANADQRASIEDLKKRHQALSQELQRLTVALSNFARQTGDFERELAALHAALDNIQQKPLRSRDEVQADIDTLQVAHAFQP